MCHIKYHKNDLSKTVCPYTNAKEYIFTGNLGNQDFAIITSPIAFIACNISKK